MMVECRDVPTKLLKEIGEQLSQTEVSLTKALDIAQQTVSAFKKQKELVSALRIAMQRITR